jgi:MFS family permease
VSAAGEIVSALGIALRNPGIRRLQIVWGAAIAAEWGHFVALGVFAYQRGGTSAVGVAGLVRLLPAAFIAPAAALLGDRFRRERFLLAVTVLGGLALAGSAAAAAAGLTVAVYVLAALVGLSATLIRPTLQALLPSLARTPEELIAANGTSSTVESIGTLAGPLIAGLLVSAATVALALAVWAGVVLAVAALLLGLKVEGRGARGEPKAVYRDIAAGLESLVRVPGARLVAGLITAQTFVRGCLNVLIVVAAFRVLHGGANAVGYMTAAIGLGGLFGALRALTLPRDRLGSRFALALVGWGVPIALIAPLNGLAAAILLLAVLGAANSIEDVAGFTLLQRTIPDAVLARTLGLVWGLAMGTVAVGSAAAPLLVHALGARPSFMIVGAILPVLTVLTYRPLAALDRIATPTPALELLERVPMLAPLSIAAKERLARSLVAVSVAPGEQVIRAGDYGDRFYILESGTVEVAVDGRQTTMQAPDSFGEIALLRDSPRTATVTATVGTRLFALERDAFLAAVTGNTVAHTTGQAVVERRLAKLP